MIVLLLANLLQVAAPAPDYVPDTGWDYETSPRNYEESVGEQLRAMRELPLASQADLAGYRERFRLVVLPSFAPAYAYSIDVRQDGTARLRWARLSGRGGYAPGILVRQGSRTLYAAELGAWSDALTVAALPALPRDEPVTDGTTNEDGFPNLIPTCFDGTELVFEHLSARGRQFVVRRCNIEDPLRRLANLVFRMKPRNKMN